jgi:hypothetical protein
VYRVGSLRKANGVARAAIAALLAAVPCCSLGVSKSDYVGGARAGGDAETPRDGGNVGDDGAVLGADGDVGPSPCPAGAAFCDDFEGDDLAEWTDRTETHGTISLVDGGTPAPFRGRHALHAEIRAATADPQSNYARVRKAVSLLQPGTVALRAYVYIVTAPTRTFDLMSLTLPDEADAGDPTNHWYLAVLVEPGEWNVLLHNKVTNFEYQGRYSGAAIPIGRWFCLEWDVKLAVDGSVDLFVDGNRIMQPENRSGPTVSTDDFVPQPFLYRASLGLSNIESQDADVYFDDFAYAAFADTTIIGTPRLGCHSASAR